MKQVSIKKNIIFNLLKTFSAFVFPLISFPYATRVLLADNIGKVNFASSYVDYFSLFATLGISTYAVRICASKRDSRSDLEETVSQLFTINCITTLISTIALILSLLFFRDKLQTYYGLIIIEASSMIFNLVGLEWLNVALEDFKYITIRTFICRSLALVAIFLFVKQPTDYYRYAIITIASSNGVYFLNVFYRRKFCSIRITNKIHFKEHIAPILFLFAMRMSQNIFNNADVTMLGLMKSDYEVGLYTTATKLIIIISQLVTSTCWVMLPRLSNLFANNEYKNINHIINKTLGIFITVGFPCCAGIVGLAEEIIVIVAGDTFLGAVPSLRILAIKFFFDVAGCTLLGNCILLPSGREKTFMIICCLTTLLNVFLNYLLIPMYGAVAASFTTAVSYFVMLVIMIIVLDKNIRFFNLVNKFFSPSLGCAIILIICFLIKSIVSIFSIRIILSILISAVLYIITVVLLKNEAASDLIESIKNVVNRIRTSGRRSSSEV